MRGKCIICKVKTEDANEGKFFEDIWIKIEGKFKWVCRDCLSVLDSKRVQGNNVFGEELHEVEEEEFEEPTDVFSMELGKE